MNEFYMELPTSFQDTEKLLDILKHSEECKLPHKHQLSCIKMEHGTENEHLGLVARAYLTYDNNTNNYNNNDNNNYKNNNNNTQNQHQQSFVKTVIVKMSPTSPQKQKHANMLHLMEREVLFYRHLKPQIAKLQIQRDLQPSIPECYFAAISNDKTQQLLVLEDLAPSKCGSIVHSCSAEEARMAIRELAKLHGVFLKDNSLLLSDSSSSSLEWLLHSDNELYRDLFASHFSSSIDAFKDQWQYVLTDHFNDVLNRMSQSVNDFMSELSPNYHFNSMNYSHDKDGNNNNISDSNSMKCLFHGDFKTENILFPISIDSKDSNSNNNMTHNNKKGKMAIVDFQTITQGSPLAAACDVAYFIFGCLSQQIITETFVEELISECYYATLKQVVDDDERMKSKYPLEQCRMNVYRGLRWAIMMIVFGGAKFKATTQVQINRFRVRIDRLQHAAKMFFDRVE